MNIELPTIPAGVMVLLGFFAPYAVALVNRPEWSAWHKRLISVAVNAMLAVVALGGYYVITKEPVPEWPQLVLLAIVVSQAAYALLLKPTAVALEQTSDRWFHPGTSLRRDRD